MIRYLLYSAVLVGLVASAVGQKPPLVKKSECTTIGKRSITAGLVYQEQSSEAVDAFVQKYTDDENVTYVKVKADDTTCHRLTWTKVLVFNGDFMAIYDKDVMKLLSEVDVIIGEYIRAVSCFAESVQKLYLVTTPYVSSESDSVIDNPSPGKISFIAKMWPSSHSFIDALHIYAHKIATRAESKDRIVLLYYTETLFGLEYVNTLYNVLSDSPTRPVDLVEIDQHLVKLVKERYTHKVEFTIDQERSYKQLLNQLREKVTRHHTQLILLYVDDPQKIHIIKVLFSKTADLERKGIPWLIADMFLPYEKEAREELQHLEVVKSTVHMYVQNYREDCLLASSVAERGTIWAYDLMIERLGRINASDVSFDYDDFRKLVMSKSDSVKGVSLNDYGERVSSIMFLNQVLPHGFDDAPSCGTALTGVFFYDPIMRVVMNHEDISVHIRRMTFKQHDGGRLKFYGMRPKDEKKAIAVVVIDKPFVMLREGVEKKRGVSQYEGIAIDIFHSAQQVLLQQGIKLELDLEQETSYGAMTDGNWTGACGRLLDPMDDAVIGLGQFSKTEEREKDFIFTNTFGYIQTTFIVQKRAAYFYMQFARPFAKNVWFWLMATMVASAMYVFMLDVWNPFKDEVEAELRYTEKESIWFSFLTCFQVGAPFGAYMFPTRVFSVFYWFFAMVVVACYTGNLASFLSDEELVRPNVKVDTLPFSKFRFGMLNQSSIAAEFKNHRKPIYNEIYNIIHERGDFVSSYEDGINRVREEPFVLIGTSGVLDYAKSNDDDCSLITDNSPKYTRPSTEIAFIMDPKWELAAEFNEAMQELMDTGELQAIYRRWMKPGRVCGGDEEEDETVRLGFDNFRGLYIILVVMIIISFICLFFKLTHLWLRDTYNKKSDAKSPEETGTGIEMLNVNGDDSGKAPLADEEALEV